MFGKRKAAPLLSSNRPKAPRLLGSSSVRSNAPANDSSYPRMKVFVRCRPLSSKEMEANSRSVIEVIDDKLLVFDPYDPEEDKNTYYYRGKVHKNPCTKAKKNTQFYFDRVFDDTDSNLQVYEDTTKELVSSLLKGYNCCVFAYGATGSGKTYTMLGTQTDPGVIIFTTMELYKLLEEKENRDMEVSVSYFEIYNEVVHDLLDESNNSKPLSLLDDGNNGMNVQNLSVHRPQDSGELLQMLEFGNKNRKQHPTDANAESSRSHAVFQITLKRREADVGNNNQKMSIQFSKMSLIDLAGSERTTMDNQGLRREGIKINQSLLALGNCINALATSSRTKPAHIPYRSSKLTLILRDSLGGKSHTMMIANVSPYAGHYNDTQKTLNYAQRAQSIKISAQRNTTSYQTQPRDMKLIITKLNAEKSAFVKEIEKKNKELAELRNELEELQSKTQDNCPTSTSSAVRAHGGTILNQHKHNLDDLFEQRLDVSKRLLDCRHQLNLIELRRLLHDNEMEKLKIYQSVKAELDEITFSMESNKSNPSHTQQLHYTNKKTDLEKELERIDDEINRLEQDLLESSDNNTNIAIREYFFEKRNELQSIEFAHSVKQTTQLATELTLKFEANNELFADLMNFNYKAFHILNGHNKLSDAMREEYKSLENKLLRSKKVSFRDDNPSPVLARRIIKLLSLWPLSASEDRSSTTPTISRRLESICWITPLNADR